MKKIISIIIALMLAIGSVLCFSGCGGDLPAEPDGQTSTALVISERSNMPYYELTDGTIFKTVKDACYTYGEVAAVSVESKPRTIFDKEIEASDKQLTEGKKQQLAKRSATEILSHCVINAAAKTPEANVLSSLKLASDLLQESNSVVKKLIVYDNGLCTTGVLNQSENDFLSADVKSVVSELKKIGALPELDSVEVIWFGMGLNAGAQNDIPSSYLQKLKNLWSEIICESGGTVDFRTASTMGTEPEGLPPVTAINFKKDSITPRFETVKFDETSSVKFISNSDEFCSYSDAQKELSPIADMMIDTPSLNVIIAGTTASAGGDGIELSMRRAEKCKSVLVDMGVNENQIRTVGLGCSDNIFHENDLDENGNLIEEIAVKNRAIYIFSEDSYDAETLEVI